MVLLQDHAREINRDEESGAEDEDVVALELGDAQAGAFLEFVQVREAQVVLDQHPDEQDHIDDAFDTDGRERDRADDEEVGVDDLVGGDARAGEENPHAIADGVGACQQGEDDRGGAQDGGNQHPEQLREGI